MCICVTVRPLSPPPPLMTLATRRPPGRLRSESPEFPPGSQLFPGFTCGRPCSGGAAEQVQRRSGDYAAGGAAPRTGLAIKNHRRGYKVLSGAQLGARTFPKILVVTYMLCLLSHQCLLFSPCHETPNGLSSHQSCLPFFPVTATHPLSPSHPSRLLVPV